MLCFTLFRFVLWCVTKIVFVAFIFCLYFFPGLVLPTLGQRAYVDPTNYDDPEAAVRDFANEIDAKALNLERVLGGGNTKKLLL